MDFEDHNTICTEDDEDCIDDPIKLHAFEEQRVFCGFSDRFTRTDDLQLVSSDHELQLKNTLLQFKDITQQSERTSNPTENSNTSICRPCSIKIVDCRKFPWFYKNQLKYRNKTSFPVKTIDHTENKKAEEMIFVDNIASPTEDYECNKANNEGLQNNCQQLLKKKADPFSDRIYNICERVIGKAIKKLRTEEESSLNRSKIRYCLNNNSSNSESVVKNRNFLPMKAPNSSLPEGVREKLSTYNTKTNCTNLHSQNIQENTGNKSRRSYLTHISRPKKNDIKKDKEFVMNAKPSPKQNVNNIKSIGINNNIHAVTQNLRDNKQEHIKCVDYSPLDKFLTKKINKKNSLKCHYDSSTKRNKCQKPIFSADRIIPHFHENSSTFKVNILTKDQFRKIVNEQIESLNRRSVMSQVVQDQSNSSDDKSFIVDDYGRSTFNNNHLSTEDDILNDSTVYPMNNAMKAVSCKSTANKEVKLTSNTHAASTDTSMTLLDDSSLYLLPSNSNCQTKSIQSIHSNITPSTLDFDESSNVSQPIIKPNLETFSDVNNLAKNNSNIDKEQAPNKFVNKNQLNDKNIFRFEDSIYVTSASSLKRIAPNSNMHISYPELTKVLLKGQDRKVKNSKSKIISLSLA